MRCCRTQLSASRVVYSLRNSESRTVRLLGQVVPFLPRYTPNRFFAFSTSGSSKIHARMLRVASPEALLELLHLVRNGGVAVLSTRTHYYQQTGFQRLIDELLDAGRIEVLQLLENAAYNHDGDGHYWVLQKRG